MPQDLEIRVLFCYSPEVLANTYNNLQELIEDNEELCSFTQDVFRKNVTTYKVTVTVANTLKVNKLQYQYGKHYNSLNEKQVAALSQCTLKKTAQKSPNKFGFMPDYLLKLKYDNNASVLILKVFAYDTTGQGELNYDYASCIGVTESRDNTVALGRTIDTKGMKNSCLDSLTLAHEFGHLMGCRHPYNPKGGEGFEKKLYKNGCHGHCVIKHGIVVCGTIMSYSKTRILYYSNPTIYRYPDSNKGKRCGLIGVSEAYKIVNINIKKLAGIFP